VNHKKKSNSKSKSTKAKKLAAKVVSTQPGFPFEITERKQAEKKLASSQKQLNDLNELQNLLLHPNTIQQKLQSVTENIVQMMGADFVRIWIIKPGDRCETGCMHAQVTDGPHACHLRERCLHLMSSSGRYTDTDSKMHGRVPFGSYKIGRIASGEEAEFLTNALTTDPRIHNRAWAKELGLVSFAGYRLVDSIGAPLGVLALFSQQVISAEQDTFLHGIAQIVSQVLLAAQVEDKLAQEQYLLRTLLNSLPDHIYFKDRHSRFTHMSESHAKRFGLNDPAEALGKTDFDFFTEEHARSAFEVEQKIMATGQPMIDLEEKETWPDGRVTWVNTTKMPLLDQAGNIIGTFGISSDITDRKRMEEEIRNLSMTDELTGLYNRRGFTLLAEQEMKLAHRIKTSMLLFFGDVDNLKTINDTHGHAQGDLALQEVSGVLKETFREADILARFGGDEFMVLAVDASMESEDILTSRIQSILERRNQQGNRPYQLSLSLGIAHYEPEAPCTMSEMIAQADGQMYQQKQEKKRIK
jgi:diguanylate cyclase (GGDEF)-like protein/PAS domain S-box-containing protein